MDNSSDDDDESVITTSDSTTASVVTAGDRDVLETLMGVCNAAKHVAMGLSAWAASVNMEANPQLHTALHRVRAALLPFMVVQSLFRAALGARRTSWVAVVRDGDDGLHVAPRFKPLDRNVCQAHEGGCLCAKDREDPDAHAIIDALHDASGGGDFGSISHALEDLSQLHKTFVVDALTPLVDEESPLRGDFVVYTKQAAKNWISFRLLAAEAMGSVGMSEIASITATERAAKKRQRVAAAATGGRTVLVVPNASSG